MTLKTVSKFKLKLNDKLIKMTNDCTFGVIGYQDKLFFWKITKENFVASNVVPIKSLDLIQNDKYLICATNYKVFQFLTTSKKVKTIFTCPKGFDMHSVSLDQTLAIFHSHSRETIFNIVKKKKLMSL